MDEFLDLRSSGRPLPPYSFCLTFDDGFENNYSVAAPILDDLGLSAMLYVTTDWIDNNHMSWIDRIELCIEATPNGSLQLPFVDGPLRFRNNAEKIDVLRALRTHVKLKPEIDPSAVVQAVFEQCGHPVVEKSEDVLDRKLTWKQLAELKTSKLFDIGGHTDTHPIMSFLPESRCQEEIRRCLAKLQSNLQVSTKHFAYPDGQQQHFNENVKRLLREAGIVCCPTAITGTNRHDADLFELRRVMVT